MIQHYEKILENELKELDDIERLALGVNSLISVTKDACQINDYTNEQFVLEYAISLQDEVIEKIINLSSRFIGRIN